MGVSQSILSKMDFWINIWEMLHAFFSLNYVNFAVEYQCSSIFIENGLFNQYMETFPLKWINFEIEPQYSIFYVNCQSIFVGNGLSSIYGRFLISFFGNLRLNINRKCFIKRRSVCVGIGLLNQYMENVSSFFLLNCVSFGVGYQWFI